MQSLPDLLFAARGDFKIRTSQIAMHLSEAQRRDIFKQLDELLDVDSWHEGDVLPIGGSFSTFLRFLIFERRIRRPSLGISNAGNVTATWVHGAARMTIEFLARDAVYWAVYKPHDGENISGAGEHRLVGVRDLVMLYDAQEWVFNAAA